MRTVLNVSKHDTVGRRFNNLDSRDGFKDYGWDARFTCWTERKGPPEVVQQATGQSNRIVTKALAKLGRYTGNVNGYYRNAGSITGLPFYRQADLLHFHIVHEEYLSIRDWMKISSGKPVVWTWHDPYMLNGHCIYSLGCHGFETGCEVCPNLDYHFRIYRDRAAKNLEEKRLAIKQIDPLVVVASEYMKDLVERSVYRDFLRVKVLPFGVKSAKTISQNEAKSRLGIPERNVVVGFRAVHSDYKGAELVRAALDKLAKDYPGFPLTVITFQEKGFCEGLPPGFQIIDAGWVSDQSIETYYAAMDFFLMPSRAEAFGMMAIEAMAAGACPIVTYGTALPELVDAPLHSICSEHTTERYAEVFEAAVLGRRRYDANRSARQTYAAEHFNLNNFCKGLATLYDEEYEHYHRVRCSA